MAKLRFGVLGAAALITTYGLLGATAKADEVTEQFTLRVDDGPSTAFVYPTSNFSEFDP